MGIIKRWTTLLLLAASRVALAQNSSTITPLMVIGAMPECAQACIISGIQAASCSMTDIGLFANCICMNEGLQSDFNICAQQGCPSMEDWGTAFGVEAELCQTYPKPDRTIVPIVAAIVGIVIVLACVGARLVARLKYTNRLWADDYVMILTAIFFLGLAAILIVSARLGLGIHIWNMKFENAIPIMKIFFASQVMYVVVMFSGKVTMLLLYLRLFNTGSARWFGWLIKVLLVLLCISQTIFLILVVLECIPISAIWDKSITNARCLDLHAIATVGSISSIVIDVILMILPIPVLWRLQVSRAKRIGLVLIFAVASLGTIASAVRFYYLAKLSGDYDDPWNHVDVTVWSLIEILCLIVCGSIPAMRPLLARAIPTINLSITWQKQSRTTNPTPKASQPSTGNSASAYSGSRSYDKKSDIWLSTLPPATIHEPWQEMDHKATAPRHAESQDRLYSKYDV
ncbi:putative Extracellular membrane protein CFEM domain-containing protein [Seiridium cardinale]|uniref:Extracellular membrane protein CFEM domain-containing protein n=1 Tax=Seiridium cardinale TaxID=138064 RepID=A0ABR2Y6H6_9PEZI